LVNIGSGSFTVDLQTVPVIDIAPFVNEGAATKPRVAAAVNRACEDIGFLVITGHGIESKACEQVFACARQFFALSVEEKLEVLKPEGYTSSAYHAFATQSYASKNLIRTAVDLRESFGMGRPDRPTGAFNLWPRRPTEFEAVFTEHFYRTERLAYDLARLFAAALELPEDYFADKLDRHDSAMLVHNYPVQETEPLPDQFRTGPHSDVGFFTILRTEREHRPGGLQVQTRSGAWIDVPAVPDSFVINIGDTLMRWSNDRWISTMHRVINPSRENVAGNSRMSLPFFFKANQDAVVECLPNCFGIGNPAKYPPVTAGAYNQESLGRALSFARQ
jgi:isopenicillin N synthase-like dioxygenase